LTLIDKSNELNIIQRKEITAGKKEQDIGKIKADWNQRFEGIGYDKLKGKLRLKNA